MERLRDLGKGPEKARERNHIDPRMLARFLRVELPRAEVRIIVRHLLARCPQCSAVTRRLWGLGEQAPGSPASPPQRGAETLRLVRGAAR